MNKITIVIPYFKLDFFEATLLSLSAQDNDQFSVFIGNDNSPQDPSSLIRKFESKLDLKYFCFTDNLGGTSLVDHWKRCLKYVDTDWFMILGDDDMLSPNAISEFYSNLENKLVSKVFRFSTQIIDEFENRSKIHSYSDSLVSSEFIYKKTKNEVRSSLSEYIFQTSDFKNFGIKSYPKAFYSDDMMVLLYSNFGKITNISNATAFIRITNKSLSGNTENKKSIELAGFQFYFELVVRYSSYFNVQQLSLFLNKIMKGVLQKKIKLSVYEFFLLCIKKIGFWRTLRKIITYVKLYFVMK